jgi:hypothetical protein
MYFQGPCDKKQNFAVIQLRRLDAGFSPRRPGFVPTSVFVVGKVALGQVSLRSPSVFPCQYHSTAASYSLIYHLGVDKEPVKSPSSTETQSHPIATITITLQLQKFMFYVTGEEK